LDRRWRKEAFIESHAWRVWAFDLFRVEEELSAVQLRVARVYIENKDQKDLIACCDRPETFFYLDPAYYGCENDYGAGIFSREDFPKLNGILKNLRGTFLLSINDHPQTREIFKGFKIVKVKTQYTAGTWTRKCKPVTELLISNF
jgi:DNA adenine methylase